jgi:hypothetical protein
VEESIFCPEDGDVRLLGNASEGLEINGITV